MPSDELTGWDRLPADTPITLTKSDIDALLVAILQVQLCALKTQGSIKSLKERDDVLYNESWESTKQAFLDSRRTLYKVYSDIAGRYKEAGGDDKL